MKQALGLYQSTEMYRVVRSALLHIGLKNLHTLCHKESFLYTNGDYCILTPSVLFLIR